MGKSQGFDEWMQQVKSIEKGGSGAPPAATVRKDFSKATETMRRQLYAMTMSQYFSPARVPVISGVQQAVQFLPVKDGTHFPYLLAITRLYCLHVLLAVYVCVCVGAQSMTSGPVSACGTWTQISGCWGWI